MRPGATIAGIQPFAELARRQGAAVYKGYDSALDRFVLLKTFDVAADDARAEQVAAEARLVAQVQHPNVVAVHAAGREGDRAYLVTEFVTGVSLAEALADGPLPPPVAAYVAHAVAAGLGAAHARGILHRDVTPANVLLGADGRVVLADFGLAALTTEVAGQAVGGTPGYLAPEVVRGETATQAADLFGLGTILAEALTGRALFRPDADAPPSAVVRLEAVLQHDPAADLAADPRVPAPLLAVLRRLIALDPADRYPDAAAAFEALDAALPHLVPPGLPVPDAPALAAYLDDPAGYAPPKPPPPDYDPTVVAAAAEQASARQASGQNTAAQRTAVPPRAPRRWRQRVAPWIGAVVVLALAATWGLTRTGLPPSAADPSRTADSSLATTAPLGDALPTDAAPNAAETETVETEAVEAETPDSSMQDASDPPEPGSPEASGEERPPETEARASGAVRPEPATGEPPARTDTVSAPSTATAPGEPAATAEAALAQLAIACDPWAIVRLNGEVLGTTPLAAPLALPPGTHRLTFENPDFPTHSETVTLAPGAEARLAVSLWQYVARLTLDVRPWAEVVVDGAVWDTVPPQTRPLVLTPGPHTLQLRHPALGTYETTVRAEAGAVRTLRFDLPDLLGRSAGS